MSRGKVLISPMPAMRPDIEAWELQRKALPFRVCDTLFCLNRAVCVFVDNADSNWRVNACAVHAPHCRDIYPTAHTALALEARDGA